MESGDWENPELSCFGMRLVPHSEGREVMVVLNSGDNCEFKLPKGGWRRAIDTTLDPVSCDTPEQGVVGVGWQSVVVWVPDPEAETEAEDEVAEADAAGESEAASPEKG